MPILSWSSSPTPALQRVCFKCQAQSAVDPTTLVLGAVVGNFKDPNIIQMPPCGSCGYTEQYNRTWDSASATKVRPRYLHRRAVNALAIWLKSNGRTHADSALAAIFAAEVSAPPDVGPAGAGADHVCPPIVEG